MGAEELVPLLARFLIEKIISPWLRLLVASGKVKCIGAYPAPLCGQYRIAGPKSLIVGELALICWLQYRREQALVV